MNILTRKYINPYLYHFSVARGNFTLSVPFRQRIAELPDHYDYAKYAEIIDDFGTHFYSSGFLGGKYEFIYRYSREALRTSGETSVVVIKTWCLEVNRSNAFGIAGTCTFVFRTSWISSIQTIQCSLNQDQGYFFTVTRSRRRLSNIPQIATHTYRDASRAPILIIPRNLDSGFLSKILEISANQNSSVSFILVFCTPCRILTTGLLRTPLACGVGPRGRVAMLANLSQDSGNLANFQSVWLQIFWFGEI